MARKVIAINLATTGNVVTAVANQTIRIYGAVILNGVATAQTVTATDKSGGTSVLRLPSSIGGGLVLGGPDAAEPLWVMEVNTAFALTLAANTQVDGTVWYTQG